MTKTRKIFLALLIIFTMLFSYFIPISKVYAENNYRISLDFINKLDSVPGISISKIYINNVEWNSKNDIFYSADDKYTIRIDYSNSTDTDPVIIYDEAWRGKIEESIFKLKGCHYNILVDNSSHNENLVISFTQQFPVSFETNGGSTIESEFVELNNKLLKPTDPTKDGYAFDGWYEDEELNKSFDFDTYITKNLTLYAKWIKAYTVTFKDGENILFTRSNITSGEKVAKPEVNPSKEGYEFKGWYADATLTTEFDFDTPITNDITLYANWLANEYTYLFLDNTNNQEVIIKSIKEFKIKIDGDHNLFESLKIGELDLIKDVDYTVTEGSTILTFTSSGIAKLNTLAVGNYNIEVNYTNSQKATGVLIIKEDTTEVPPTPANLLAVDTSETNKTSNPKTGNNIYVYISLMAFAMVGIIITTKFLKKRMNG